MKETSSFQSLNRQRLILWQKGLSWFKSGLKLLSFKKKHGVRHMQGHWPAQRPQFYTFFNRIWVLSLSSSAALLSASSAGQGVTVRTVMPFAPALGQEVCVWVSPGRLCWDEHATAPDLCHPPWCRVLAGVWQRKSKGQRQTGMRRALLTGISFGFKLLPKSYSVCLTCPLHLELNVKLCIIIFD